MAGHALIIVESPAKARTIERFLGKGYEVESSIGHVRDLPSNASEIPKRYKDEQWARLGVDVTRDFKPLYVVPNAKRKQVKHLREKLAEADELYLATDEDREGEAIAWHLVELLEPRIPVKRMVFHEITSTAIRSALEATRDIDQRLVSAQEARRILDRLVGYEVSPILWRKVQPRLSAGRVQSVATRLVVSREEARMRFVEASYCGLEALFEARPGGEVPAKLVDLGGRRLATGKDFDPDTGKLATARPLVLDEPRADALRERLSAAPFAVAEVQEKPFSSRPYPPFMTSTLQQEASRKLRFKTQRTMRVAQSLYENGYITYMRTDSVALSGEAISAARAQAEQLYGPDFIPDQPRRYAAKSKTAQEAHEAIRPAGEQFRTPQEVKGELDRDQYRLYELIWMRTLACQMSDARGRRTTVRIEAEAGDDGTAGFTASGKVIDFPGFLRAYVEGSDDPEAELADQEKLLPPLAEGESLEARRLEVTRHTTQPPARYTEASLVKELESLGIGRPSTYATIISTIQDRGYVFHRGNTLVPTFTAFAVVKLLEENLPDLVDFNFTARMEAELDTIARGERQAEPWLHEFYFGAEGGNGTSRAINRMGLRQLIAESGDSIDAREASRIPIGKTEEGQQVVVRVGRYGPYVQLGESEQRASVPPDLPPDELTVKRAVALLEEAKHSDRELGVDPETGKTVFIKTGRYGPYVQLGEPERTPKGNLKKGGKPKMASLWDSMEPADVTLEQALMLLSFPREVGTHPETEEVITAQDGRYGPYLKMGSETRSLENQEQLATVTVDEAVRLFKQPKAKGRRRSAPAVMREIGTHPDNDQPVQLKSGRFGPYVTDGQVNASLPKGTDPDAVDLEQAVELIAARETKLRAQGKDPRAPKKKGSRKSSAKGTKKKAAGKKKAAKKKPAAKKKAAGKKKAAKKEPAK
jgi:DNA topoisomerase-1